MAVSFEEGQFSTESRPQVKRGITAWLVQRGYADTEQQALQLELILAVVGIVVAIIIMYVSFSKPAPTQQEIRMRAWMESGNHGIPPDSFMPTK